MSTKLSWCAQVAAGAVGVRYGEVEAVTAAVVFPASTLVLPQPTMRNLRSLALIRLSQGALWKLSVVGYQWTDERLASVAKMLEAQGETGPNAVLTNRIGDQLGLPDVRIERPTVPDLEGSAWDVRPLAVALALARMFAYGPSTHLAISSVEVDELADAIRLAIADGMARFRSRLDSEALALCMPYGDSASSVYNYLTSHRHRRNRIQFARVLPVLLKMIESDGQVSPYREIREAVDMESPLASLVCKSLGIEPSTFRCLIGVNVDVCGTRWLEAPTTLMRLINSIRPDRRPRAPEDWSRINQLVEYAERVQGRSLEQSIIGQLWVRDTVHSGATLDASALQSNADARIVSHIETFREELVTALGDHQAGQNKPARRLIEENVRQIVDALLLRRTPRQLTRLALRWHEVMEEARAGDETLIACMRGERYWPLLPSAYVSASGRRRVEPLVTRKQLAAHGTAMGICLGGSALPSYDRECRSGSTFVVALVDDESDVLCSTAELRVSRPGGRAAVVVKVAQHTAKGNAAPSLSCTTAMRELMTHIETEPIQRHLRLGVSAVRASRWEGVGAIASVRRSTSMSAFRSVLGEPIFDDLVRQCQHECEQLARNP